MLTVMSFNIRHCKGIDEKVNVARIANVIKQASPDLVALQEVDRGVARTARQDIAAELAKRCDMHVFFAKNIELDGGEYGNAVLSRFAIKEASNRALTMIGDGEQRGAIRTVIAIPQTKSTTREVVFIATHLDHRDSDVERVLSTDELHSMVSENASAPTIVAGDFNSVPGSRVHQKMKRNLRDVWEHVGEGDGLTSPADCPVGRIDYIWISQHFAPLEMHVLLTQASDHFAIASRLELC
jgi:endonuclease/exonuclease/phosphatase family metal-dependent hydrolase